MTSMWFQLKKFIRKKKIADVSQVAEKKKKKLKA